LEISTVSWNYCTW